MPRVVPQPTLRLAAGARLETPDPALGLSVLHHAAGSVALNATAAEILRLCNGRHSRLDVMRRVNGNPRHVNAFLDAACKLAWITEDTSHTRKH